MCILLITAFLISIAFSISPLPPGRDGTPFKMEFPGLGTGTGIIDSVYPDVVQLRVQNYILLAKILTKYFFLAILQEWDRIFKH